MNPIHNTTRHIIVCEGESERKYLQQLQSFLDKHPTPDGSYDQPLIFIPSTRVTTHGGHFTPVIKDYRAVFKKNRPPPRKTHMHIWVDFDLYHRNDHGNADSYKRKSKQHPNIPDFHFSFYNFEDFIALHLDDAHFNEWKRIFQENGHFVTPLHEIDYLPAFRTLMPAYRKGDLPAGFVSQASLARLKRHKSSQPRANPKNLPHVQSFADFLVTQIEKSYPSLLI